MEKPQHQEEISRPIEPPMWRSVLVRNCKALVALLIGMAVLLPALYFRLYWLADLTAIWIAASSLYLLYRYNLKS